MADVYVDTAQDGTICLSIVGANDPAVHFGNTKKTALPVDGNSLRVSLNGTSITAVVAGQNDHAYLANDFGQVLDLGQCFGRQAVCIRRMNDGSRCVNIIRSNGICEILNENAIQRIQSGNENFFRRTVPAPNGGLGILDINDDGTPVFAADPAIDGPRQRTVRGLLLNNWTERSGIVAGLLLGLGDQLVIADETNAGSDPISSLGTIYPGLAFEPHLTALDAGGVAISYRTLGGYGVKILRSKADWPAFEFKIAPLGKKAVGVIFGSSEKYGYGAFAGNCEVLLPGDDFQKMKFVKSVVAAEKALNVPWPLNLGTWHDTAHSVPPYAGMRPHFVYDEIENELHDGRGDVLLIQAYPLWGEAPRAFELRMAFALARHKGRQIILVFKFYPGNPPFNFTEAQLVQYFGAYERLVRRDDVQGLLAFDGMRSGLAYHPLWLKAFEAFAAATSGLPEFKVVAPDPEPDPEPPPPTFPRARSLTRTNG